MYSDVFDAISIIGDWPEKKILSLVTAVQLSLLFRLSATSDGTIVIIIIIIMDIVHKVHIRALIHITCSKIG